MADGSIVGLEASTPPHIPVHEQTILKHPMAFPPGIAEMHGTRILSKIAAFAPIVSKAEYDHMTLGFRPMPADGFPVVGPVPGVPGVSVCVTHSGVTLAAVLGSAMAREVLAGKTEPLLAPYRPNRSFPPVTPA
jgi:glycine/D-amino acid oxidase-like deaminating enzyme